MKGEAKLSLKVVYITNGMSSTLNSSLELSRRLERAGHRVTYLSPVDLEAPLAAQGHAFERLEGDRELGRQAEAEGSLWRALKRPHRLPGWLRRRRDRRRRSLENSEIEHRVRALEPDLLLIDIEMHFAILATASLGIPTLLPIVWFSLFRQPDLPPLHTDLLPGRPKAIALAWWRLRFSTFRHEWRQRLGRWARGEILRPVPYDTFSLDDLRDLARAKGFDFRRETTHAHWLRPYLYRRLPILCYNAWEMEFPQPRHPNVHYVGPMVHRGRREAQMNDDDTEGWRRFLETRQPDRPLIYCSLGTFWAADVAFLRRVVSVFEGRRDWDLVLGLGGKLDPEALGEAPSNVLAARWAPQLEVLEHAACAITHGGITSINECIHLEVPMVVYSTGYVDQNGCAARVAHHGLGVVGEKDAYGPTELEAKIERVLGNPEFLVRIAAMRRTFQAYEEPDAALALIEEMAAKA